MMGANTLDAIRYTYAFILFGGFLFGSGYMLWKLFGQIWGGSKIRCLLRIFL